MSKKYDIHKAAGIIIVERKLLVTRAEGKDTFISPGGRVEKNEKPLNTVIRELEEEVSITTTPHDLVKFGIFYAEAADDPGSWLRMDAFLVKKWTGKIVPNNGEEVIEEILWLNSKVPEEIKVGSIFEHQVIPQLNNLGLID